MYLNKSQNINNECLLYSDVSDKRTVFNNRTGPGDKLSKKNKRTGWKSSSISIQVIYDTGVIFSDDDI